jgi:MFS family permease
MCHPLVGELYSNILQLDVAEVRVVKGSEAYNEALIAEKPPVFHRTSLLLLLCVMLGFFCQTMNGFDGSLFGGLTANKTFLEFFDGTNKGMWAGLISAMYQIGGVCALPFVGPAIDTWGRRAGMFIGSVLIILGAVITGTTIHNASVHQFMGGRFLLGFGVSIASAAGPIYVVETTHPAFRGIATAYCNTFWFTGSILSSGAIRGGLNISGNTSWQLPVWLQVLFPGLICLFCFLIPESPRWLYVNNKREGAVNMLTKWHGYGNRENPWVRLQLEEYEEFLNLDGAVSKFVIQIL